MAEQRYDQRMVLQLNFAEIDEHRELTPEELLVMFAAILSAMIDGLGENEVMEELAAAYNGIYMASQDPPEHVKIAMEIAGKSKPTIQ